MFGHKMFLKLTAKLKQLKNWKALQQECGSVLIFTAVAIPIFLGLTGIAFDVGNLYMHKARLQNVADAAALAGARAFADSQANADENDRDKVDQKITVTSYKPPVTYYISDLTKDPSERFKDHGTVSSTSPHPHADEEADKYIYNNLVNLGNNISTDLYSHYALLSKEINPRTFYRVGLVEDVDLYFLPIIRGIGKKQPVGVEAIVLLSEDKGEEIPATVFSNLFTYTGKLTVKNTNEKGTIKTVFDGQMFYTGDSDNASNPSNYFEISDSDKHLYSTVDKTIKNDPKPHSTINLNAYMDFFNEKLQQAKAMNACVEIDVSNPNERKLLNVGNINNLNSDLYKKHEKDINGNFMYKIEYSDEFTSYVKKEFYFSIDKRYDDDNDYRKYYSIDDEGNIMYCLKYDLDNGLAIRVPSYSYIYEDISDADGFRPPYIDPIYNRKYQYYVVDGSKNRIYYSIDTVRKDGRDKNGNNKNRYWVYFVTANTEKMQILDAYWTDTGTNNNPKWPDFYLYPWQKNGDYFGTHYKYSTKNMKNVDYQLINFRAFKDEKFTTKREARKLRLNTNVIDLINNNPETYKEKTTLVINEAITGHGNTSEPIYIFDHTGNTLEITNNKDGIDSGRPIVIVYCGKDPDSQDAGQVNTKVQFESKLNITVYAPKATVENNIWSYGTIEGNIVARDIKSIGNARSGGASFVQKNHLESDTDLYGKIIQYAQNDNNGEAQLFSDVSDPSKPPSNTYNSSWENWYSSVEKSTAETWFNSLNHNQQVAFWRAWDAAHRPPNADEYGNLFPDQGPYHAWYDLDGWKDPEHGWFFPDWSPTPDEKNDAKINKDIQHVFDTKVRLINPRLEANPFNS